MILATALENGCNIIYSEDMQNGQIIENQLTIINPFEGVKNK
jgi:predicted nucleic acid-binding protein